MDSSQPDPPSVEDLLRSGKPFVPFPEFSVHYICDLSHEEAIDWLECKLQEEKPFIIHGFDKLDKWDKRILSSKSLVDLSSSGCMSTTKQYTFRNSCLPGLIACSNTCEELSDGTRCAYEACGSLPVSDGPYAK